MIVSRNHLRQKGKTSPSKEELIGIIDQQKKKSKSLQQKASSSLVQELKEKSLIDKATAVKLNEDFSGLT